MTILEAINARHSVRTFSDCPIPSDIREALDAFAETCNQEANLHISIRYDDAEGFDSRLAHYGHFQNVNNYIILAGKKNDDFEFRCGYYGEKIVLYAQQLGLNTCWAALTFNKKNVKKLLQEGETLCMVIALGYGETQGRSRKSKTVQDVVAENKDYPEWFVHGVEAALKAPTAVNQQKFQFSLRGETPMLKVHGIGSYTKVDLGIVAYHFEAASGHRVER